MLCGVWLLGGYLLRPTTGSEPHGQTTRPRYSTARGAAHRTSTTATVSTTRATTWGVVAGLALSALFLAGGFFVQYLPALVNPVNTLLQHSAAGSIWGVTTVTMLGGISEEYYFRRALLFHQPTARTQLLIPTLAYVLVTATSGIVLLTFAALLVGITTALLTIASERILPAIIAHLLWSASMLYLLPLITAGWAFTG